MNKWEKAILGSRTPEEYVDLSFRSRLSPPEKARIAKAWMESTGYSREDILFARNRHPYWKKRKMEGAAERTRARLDRHDYSGGREREWTTARIAEFLELNRKDRAGHYLHKDWELADHFATSIPSIQYMRRKYSKVRALVGLRAPKTRIIDGMRFSEATLAQGRIPKTKRA